MKKTKKRVKISNFEKLVYIATIILILSFPLISVYSKSTLTKVNYEVEEIKEEVKEQTKENDSLEMKINELASLENLESIAKEMGLSYTYNSVKTVD